MPDRIAVTAPSEAEQSRQLAEAIADLHEVIGIIVESRGELLPGEAVDELDRAWKEAGVSIEALVKRLDPGEQQTSNEDRKVLTDDLRKAALLGETGKAKRSMLGRLRDRFLMFWRSEPHTEGKAGSAAGEATDYLELGATVVSSIPGQEKVVEFVSLVKQLVGLRARRGV